MGKYKTHKGRVIDMDALRVQQENTVAAGNMGVNARGDKLGKDGKVVQSAADIARKGKKVSNIKRTSLKPASKGKVEEALPLKEEVKKPATKRKPVKKTISKAQETELDDGSIMIEDAVEGDASDD